MQHHGAPTRLLDSRWSPYVAHLRAVPGDGDAAVWPSIGDDQPSGAVERQRPLFQSAVDPTLKEEFRRTFSRSRYRSYGSASRSA